MGKHRRNWCQNLKPEKEDRCWYKIWKVSHGYNDSGIRKQGMAETAVTDHKLKGVVDIKPTQDCISSIIKHRLITQDEYLSSVKKPMIFSSFFTSLSLRALVDLERLSRDRSSAGFPDASKYGANRDHQRAACRDE